MPSTPDWVPHLDDNNEEMTDAWWTWHPLNAHIVLDVWRAPDGSWEWMVSNGDDHVAQGVVGADMDRPRSYARRMLDSVFRKTPYLRAA